MNENNTAGFIRQKQLLPILGFSAPTLWRKVRDGSFPKPVKLSTNITAWNKADILLWIEEKKNG
jgi:prophage regulatory protein